MSNQSHEHAKHQHGNKGKWQLHKDWRAWLAVILMMAAVIMYVLSLDDSIVPR